jgi:transcriptional regulator with XRE-family HTH domain
MPPVAPQNRLREIREAKGLERYDIAAHMRLSADTVRRWEKELIPTQHVIPLARFLEVEPAHLMGWDREGAAAA